MFLTNFAPRHLIDDDELGDVSVAMLAVHLRCAFVYLVLDTDVVLLLVHLCFEIAK